VIDKDEKELSMGVKDDHPDLGEEGIVSDDGKV
jgi:hypothetical protein